MSDPFGRALLDHARGERTAPLRQIDGEWERDHPIEQFYFEPRDPEAETTAFLERHLHGPLVDLGAGVGRDVRYFSEQCETVGLERSPHLVTAMEERGVERAVEGDMFALQATFDRDRFASALAVGTQLGLAQSPAGVQSFLADLAYVTRPDATAVVDAYDPTSVDAADLLGYRSEPTPGLAGRVMHFAYEGERGETLLFRLFSPARLRAAVAPTRWRVVDTLAGDSAHYRVALRKE